MSLFGHVSQLRGWHGTAEREREREIPMLVEHRAYSARAKCTRRGHLLHIDYLGVLSSASFRALERLTLPSRMDSMASFERMDAALMALAGPIVIPRENYPPNIPPSAVIVPPALWERSTLFCLMLAKLGVLRVPFLPDETEVALRWAACFAGGRASSL